MLTGGKVVALGLLLIAQSLPGVDLPNAGAVRTGKIEIKLLVAAENVARPRRALQLDEHQAVKETVCYFDTRDGKLEANHLVLRARQKAGQPGESTMKLLSAAGATDLSDTERAIEPEQDWTSEIGPTIARSLNRGSLGGGLVFKVALGRAAVAELFNGAQRKLVETRMKEFNWESLRRYGPVEAKVWHQHWKLAGTAEPVTAELWHLRQDGRARDVLEVSTKARAETEAEGQALARQFFAAAKAAGLGEPSGQSKTKTVLDFFKPGR